MQAADLANKVELLELWQLEYICTASMGLSVSQTDARPTRTRVSEPNRTDGTPLLCLESPEKGRKETCAELKVGNQVREASTA